MVDARHLTMVELEAGLDTIRQSPKDAGELVLIVRRPLTDQREILEEGELLWDLEMSKASEDLEIEWVDRETPLFGCSRSQTVGGY